MELKGEGESESDMEGDMMVRGKEGRKRRKLRGKRKERGKKKWGKVKGSFEGRDFLGKCERCFDGGMGFEGEGEESLE